MTIQEIYNRVPSFLRKWNTVRKADRVEIERLIFAGTLAEVMGIDIELIHDNGKKFVIFSA